MKRIERIKTDYSAFGGMILTKMKKALPQAKAKSVLIRLIRVIRFTIMSLLFFLPLNGTITRNLGITHCQRHIFVSFVLILLFVILI